MATTKGKGTTPTPIQFKSKSRGTSGKRYVAITLLVEETGQTNVRSAKRTASEKKPLIVGYFEQYLKNGYSYGFGDWAVKSIELTEKQFADAYEQL